MTSSGKKSGSAIVLGGGAVGMCVALALQESGWGVTVVDPGDLQRQASWGNAGRIAVELCEPLASLKTLRTLPGALFSFGGPVALPLNSAAAWLPFGLRLIAASTPARFARGNQALSKLLSHALPAWRRRLDASGAPGLLAETGHYSLWENSGSFAEARAHWTRDAGAATSFEPDAVTLARLHRLVRVPLAGALGFSGTGSITDLPALQVALRAAFTAGGGVLRSAPLTLEAAALAADCVVVAAGVGSARVLEALGHSVPLIAERGYHIHQPLRPDATAWPLDMPPLQIEDRSLVVTRFASGLRITSVAEFSTAAAPPDPRKWRRLRLHAHELGLPFDDGATEWFGSRPTLPDYLPAIGRSAHHPKVYYAFGHQHLGLTLAAITGELVATLVGGAAPAVSLAPFDLARF